MPTQSRYTWDLKKLQFRDGRTGRYVAPDRVFRQVNQVINVSERRMLKLAEQVRSRAITIDAFKLAMRTEIKTLHVATAIAGNGGLAQMTAKRWGKVGGALRREYAYLNRFGRELASGRLALTSGRVRARARSYTANARLTYWNTLNARMTESGVIVEASRKLGPVETEHCPGCAGVAGEWMPLPQLPALGSMECKWFCACLILYRLTRVPRLDQTQAAELEAMLDDTASNAPALATELTRRELEVLETIRFTFGSIEAELLAPAEREAAERLLAKGTLVRRKEDGRFVYHLQHNTPTKKPRL